MPRPRTLRLILGDQLNHLHHWFKKPDDQVSYVMMEIRQETDYATHHIQKVAAFFAAMRAFGDYLRNHGHQLSVFEAGRLPKPANHLSQYKAAITYRAIHSL
jgi:deoxyribodipyrimidine photolyase-related protein